MKPKSYVGIETLVETYGHLDAFYSLLEMMKTRDFGSPLTRVMLKELIEQFEILHEIANDNRD